MATTKRSDIIVPEILLEAIKGKLAGMKALYGTSAARIEFGLPGDRKGGDKVKVPYFGHIGEMEEVLEGEALTPRKITQTSEEATVIRAGIAFEATAWGQIAGAEDPYEEGSRQMRESVERYIDSKLIVAASANLPADMVKDVYNANAPRVLDWNLMVDGKMAWGDEQDDIALMITHSKVVGDLLKAKDNSGRPLYTPGNGKLGDFCGVPHLMSDKLVPDTGKYTSLVLKRNALIFWANGNPSFEADRDILAHSTIAALNMYGVAHRYLRSPGGTKGGVVALRHN